MSSSTSAHTAEPIRVALIGFGLAGSVFHAPLITTTPGLRLAAVVTSNPERQQQVRARYPQAIIYSQPQELWHDAHEYDLVVVATANRAHVPLGLAALHAGLNVVIDKPLAATVTDAERLIATSRETGKLLTVFQNRRWDSDFLTIRKLLHAEVLGPITRFESRFERYRPQPRIGSWKESANPEDAPGQLFDLGSHLIDQVLLLFGKPERIYAEISKRREHAQTDDDSFVALHFPTGIQAHLWVSQVARISGPRFLVRGLRGTYEKWGLDPQEDALKDGKTPENQTIWGAEPRERWGRLATSIGGINFDGQIETEAGNYPQFYAQLRDALRNGRTPPVDPYEVIEVLRVIEAAHKSSQERRLIDFPIH
ncbi:Gfo/Idh/MocA family oxidoreductase [Ktedonospora formicarum]|uniref:Oxidoreductase n=1 Tax=Ktedonospora formicarum TaxID=2778364 RepID=A0A8J3MRZ5_9CHLR|nr:Gfo/Idh/MocA family oxidoreductase [Ktedonospora formicarum]GHO42815.1 oxidoreductase [Ktedonospora formicarum]